MFLLFFLWDGRQGARGHAVWVASAGAVRGGLVPMQFLLVCNLGPVFRYLAYAGVSFLRP